MTEQVLELLQRKGNYVQVSGRDYLIKCLNPEHIDRNPSLRIDKDSGIMNCLSCGFKGNIFSYYGVFYSRVPLKIAQLKDKLRKIRDTQFGLDFPKGATPWVKPFRGISVKTLKHFEAFYTNTDEALEDRIVFPIRDILGRIQVFCARHVLSDGNPRYLNYPRHTQLPLFPAKVEDTTVQSIILVEGIFDMINLYDKGLTNVVCTFGTNPLMKDTKDKLIPYKIQGISKVFILYDPDQAGKKAAKELKPLIEAAEFEVEIIDLPDGIDPGDLDQENVTAIKAYVQN